MKKLMKNITFLCCMLLIQPLFSQDAEYKVYLDAPLYLEVPEPNDSNSYTWYKEGEPLMEEGPTFYINNVTENDIGLYTIEIDDNPNETILIDVKKQKLATDSIGGEYNAGEFIIKFEETASQFQMDSLRMEYNAILLDTCLCDLELWYMSDTINPENKKEGMETEPEIETVDYNYVIKASAKGNYRKTPTAVSRYDKVERQTGGTALVAIIDTGVDVSHNDLQGIFWTNPDENASTDNDGNCLVGDVNGYDFIDNDSDPNDRRWTHATHLAGLVDSISLGQAEIMNLKIFSAQTKSTLFPGTCATYYAGQKDADIINMSWGWQGLPAKILKNAIDFAGDSCGALVICSAGNKGMNNDSFPHYPSGYELENVIEVAAVDVNGDGANPSKAWYSNYGRSIDVAVPGFWWSTVPGNATDSLNGTSMSAAVLSGMAARMFADNTNAGITWKEVRDCILNSSDFENDLYMDSLNGQWFSTDLMDQDVMNCIDTISTGMACPSTVSIPIFETIEIEKMSIFPIPFNDWVDFGFELENSGDVIFEIYDISGRKVHAEKMWMPSGEQRISWNGSHLSKGMYVCYIRNTRQHFSGKMVKLIF